MVLQEPLLYILGANTEIGKISSRLHHIQETEFQKGIKQIWIFFGRNNSYY